MNLTLTGVDESTSISDILDLSREGVEIGVLYTYDPEGRPRYPSRKWIDKLIESEVDCLAIHVCGRKARAEMLGDPAMFNDVNRIQVNGKVYPGELERICALQPYEKIITQHQDGLILLPFSNHQILVDDSGGRGLLPSQWVRPETHKAVGFAGGLGPYNLREELPKIMAIADDLSWIDMESGIRTDDKFDMKKAMKVVEIRNDLC